jgi:hypothetical protein
MGKPPLPPYNVQVFTTEYLIEGTMPGSVDLYFLKPDQLGQPISLSDVRIQSTRSPQIPSRSCFQYNLTRNKALIIIPQTDYTQLSFYSAWKNYKNPVPGQFHIGHYLMTGKLMTGPGGFLSGDLPAYDVRIESLVPGLSWSHVDAPFALVNCFYMQGWETGQ